MIEDPLAIEYVPLEQLQQHPRNANNGDMKALEESMTTNGFFSPLLVQRSTGYILAGNHRYQVATKLGYSELPVIYLDVDDARAIKVMLSDNRITRLGYDDEAQLADLLETVYQTDEGLSGTGFTSGQMEDLLTQINEALEFEVPKPEKDDDDDTMGHTLRFSVFPQVSEDGKCYEFVLSRPGYTHLTAYDLQVLRKALGLAPLSDAELGTYDIPSWHKG